MYKAIFFDLDDTLIDSLNCHKNANRQTFIYFHIDYDETLKRIAHEDFMGKRVIDILAIMRDSMGITESHLPLTKLTAKREEIFLKLLPKHARLLPGAKDALTVSKNYNQQVAIVSSGTLKYIHTAIQLFALDKFIDFIISGEDVTHGKPHPDCYLKALAHVQNKFLIKPSECLVVEDAPNGVNAAQAAGLPVCYVPSTPPAPNTNVDHQLNSLLEFAHLIQPQHPTTTK